MLWLQCDVLQRAAEQMALFCAASREGELSAPAFQNAVAAVRSVAHKTGEVELRVQAQQLAALLEATQHRHKQMRLWTKCGWAVMCSCFFAIALGSYTLSNDVHIRAIGDLMQLLPEAMGMPLAALVASSQHAAHQARAISGLREVAQGGSGALGQRFVKLLAQGFTQLQSLHHGVSDGSYVGAQAALDASGGGYVLVRSATQS